MSVLHAHGDSAKIPSQNFTETFASCRKRQKKREKQGVIFQRSQAALRFLLPSKTPASLFSEMLSLIRAWRTEESNARLSTSLTETLSTSHAELSNIQISTFFVQIPLSPSLLLGLKYSMTLLLITSACQGNFVRQNRNALFW